MYAMDSVLLSRPQIIKMNAVHFKVMRSIFGFKSSYYHRVIAPTDAPCSNEFLADTSFRTGRVITPSQLYSQCKLQLLGHLMRHPESLEYQAAFMNSGAYRFTRGSNRTGRPKVHWAVSSLTEATARLEHLQSDAAPAHGDINHSFYQIRSLDQVRISHGSQGIVWMDNTILHRKVRQAAQDRRQWAKLINKPQKPRSRRR